MKRVIKNADMSDLYVLKTLLESNGIPVFISGEDSGRLLPFLLSRPGLWIYFDEQYDEALALIKDPDYDVVNKVDIEAFYKMVHDPSNPGSSGRSAFLSLVAYLGVIILMLLLAIKLLQWLQA
jgi:hypothetical protein